MFHLVFRPPSRAHHYTPAPPHFLSIAYHTIPNAAASNKLCRGSSLIQIFRSGGNFGTNAGIRAAIAFAISGLVFAFSAAKVARTFALV